MRNVFYDVTFDVIRRCASSANGVADCGIMALTCMLYGHIPLVLASLLLAALDSGTSIARWPLGLFHVSNMMSSISTNDMV